jgi:thiol-disulfide isomerase/thioredoxin
LLNGTKKRTSDYQGNILLIDFMGANCEPCQLQLITLHQIYHNYSKKNLEIISINVWIILGESSNLLQQLIDLFKTELDVDLDWTFGVDDAKGTLYFEYANQGVPALYLLDENGNIYYTFQGYTSYYELVDKIDELI